jgi:hypothetical protein
MLMKVRTMMKETMKTRKTKTSLNVFVLVSVHLVIAGEWQTTVSDTLVLRIEATMETRCKNKGLGR